MPPEKEIAEKTNSNPKNNYDINYLINISKTIIFVYIIYILIFIFAMYINYNIINNNYFVNENIALYIGYAYFIVTLSFLFVLYLCFKATYDTLLMMGITDMRWHPAWYVGWAFIPIANLVMPGVAMAQLERAARHLAEHGEAGGAWNDRRYRKSGLRAAAFWTVFLFFCLFRIIADNERGNILSDPVDGNISDYHHLILIDMIFASVDFFLFSICSLFLYLFYRQIIKWMLATNISRGPTD